jgi:hypothetical protein
MDFPANLAYPSLGTFCLSPDKAFDKPDNSIYIRLFPGDNNRIPQRPQDTKKTNLGIQGLIKLNLMERKK